MLLMVSSVECRVLLVVSAAGVVRMRYASRFELRVVSPPVLKRPSPLSAFRASIQCSNDGCHINMCSKDNATHSKCLVIIVVDAERQQLHVLNRLG